MSTLTPSRILVVDDEAELRQIFGDELTAAGFEVVYAGSGREACLRLDESSIDVVVCDLSMNDGDGRIVLAYVRQGVVPRPTVIVVSGHVYRFDAEVRQLGAFATLNKPFRPSELTEMVRDALRERSA